MGHPTSVGDYPGGAGAGPDGCADGGELHDALGVVDAGAGGDDAGGLGEVDRLGVRWQDLYDSGIGCQGVAHPGGVRDDSRGSRCGVDDHAANAWHEGGDELGAGGDEVEFGGALAGEIDSLGSRADGPGIEGPVEQGREAGGEVAPVG